MTTPAVDTLSRCSIARSLEVLGEKWTLLIVRNAFMGQTRFSQFRDGLGIAKDVLADRLATLVDIGVMERRAYREPGERERFEYVLTPAGAQLKLVLGSLIGWGDENRPSGFGPSSIYIEAATGDEVHLEFRTADGRAVALENVSAIVGPGAL